MSNYETELDRKLAELQEKIDAKKLAGLTQDTDEIVLPEEQIRSIEKTKTNLSILVDVIEHLVRELDYVEYVIPKEWHKDIVLLWLEKQLEA